MQASITQAIVRYLIEERDGIIIDLAFGAIDVSPVDTGAYVTSFSATTSSGSGRSRSSHGKTRNQSPAEKKGEAKQQILSDVSKIPPDVDVVYITNRAPHAPFVEGRGSAPMTVATSGRTGPMGTIRERRKTI